MPKQPDTPNTGKPDTRGSKPAAKKPDCAKCAELEERIAKLELSRRADDERSAAAGWYPLSIFEEKLRAEDE